MQKAARLTDPIQHTSALSGLLVGLLIGAAIAVAAVAIIGTGGLAAVAIVGAGAAMGAGIGELVGSLSFAKTTTGTILQVGSFNTKINSLNAARAHVDVVMCSNHPNPPKPIATGSSNVFINSMPAARVGDKTGCDAEISDGSKNVFIGGGTVQTDEISPEVPGWLHTAVFAVGMASAVVLAGPVAAFAGLIGGLLGGAGGNWLGGKLFGQGSDGQKLTAFAGAMVGGILGGKGGAWFDKNYVITTEGLGSNFGNVRITPRAGTAAADALGESPESAVANSANDEGVSPNGGSTYKQRLDQTPVNNGSWTGTRGESKFVSTDPEVTPILEKHGIDGIEYSNAQVDFSPVAKEQVPIDNMTASRPSNFRQADQALADKWGVSRKDVATWREENAYTWHEEPDLTTMQLVPGKINGKFGHLGGVGEINKGMTKPSGD
jgi:uncharacterized Zn-binding protein involved in type VI secretion